MDLLGLKYLFYFILDLYSQLFVFNIEMVSLYDGSCYGRMVKRGGIKIKIHTHNTTTLVGISKLTTLVLLDFRSIDRPV